MYYTKYTCKILKICALQAGEKEAMEKQERSAKTVSELQMELQKAKDQVKYTDYIHTTKTSQVRSTTLKTRHYNKETKKSQVRSTTLKIRNYNR